HIDGTVGRYSLRVVGGGAAGAGFRRVFRTHAGEVVEFIQPSYVSYRVHTEDAANQGALYLGGNAAGFEDRFLPMFFAQDDSVCVGAPMAGGACTGTVLG